MKVYELLEKPENWVQGMTAVDSQDELVSIHSPRACKWCLYGAICKCYSAPDAISDVFEKLRDKMTIYESFIRWNDSPKRTHDEVLALCKELDI